MMSISIGEIVPYLYGIHDISRWIHVFGNFVEGMDVTAEEGLDGSFGIYIGLVGNANVIESGDK